MIQANKIKAIRYGALKEPGDRKRKIPTGMFDPHMTWMISGKTGSGKSTALIQMLKAYCDSGVFQKVVLISPTAAYDAKYKLLPLSAVHEDYSDELLSDIMEEQKEDMEEYQQTEEDIRLYQKFMRHKAEQGFQKKEHTFHSFRSTLATLFQSAGVEELFAARIIGHKAGGMTYGLYAGDLDWDKAVEAMAKVDFKKAA